MDWRRAVLGQFGLAGYTASIQVRSSRTSLHLEFFHRWYILYSEIVKH